MTLPADAARAGGHAQYLLDNLDEVLADLGATLVSKPEKVQKKGKAKGAVVEAKTQLRVAVPGTVLAAAFAERKKSGKSLLLEVPQGPYCHTQFMGYVSKHMAESKAKLDKMAAETPSEQLRERMVDAVGKVTAATSREIASANRTLSVRLMELEAAKGDLMKAAKKVPVEAARKLVAKLEREAEEAIGNVTGKWERLIELRVAVEAKVALKEKEAREQQEKAIKRKRDLEERATRAVQRDVLANAAKRARVEEPKFSGRFNNGPEAAALGAWLKRQAAATVSADGTWALSGPSEAAAAPAQVTVGEVAERLRAEGGLMNTVRAAGLEAAGTAKAMLDHAADMI